MKIFFCGNFTGHNGPGIANQNLKDGFCRIQAPGDKFIFSMAEKKEKRILELRHIVGSDALVLCSVSLINKYAVWCAKLFHVKIVYLAHGLSTIEQNFYKDNTRAEQKYEKFMFSRADKIVAVSKKFAGVIKEKYAQYADKVAFCYNSVPNSLIDGKNQIKNNQKSNRIISVGGSMYQKCMLPVCRAVERINKKRGMNLEFMIIGGSKDQIEEINRYSCVTYIENLSHEELMLLFQEGGIYVQNSKFETFGLAIVEALAGGCDLLISSRCGVTDLFDGIRDEDIIWDNEDIDEIASKIEQLLDKGNREYLDSHFLWEVVKTETAATRMMNLLRSEGAINANNDNDTGI